MSKSPNQDAALSLASTFHIFPCNPDKTPLVKAWEQNATQSLLTITAWWSNSSNALPAIPVGAHSLVVIDCDRKNGKDGVTAFTAMCAAHSIDLSNAFVVETPSGGIHAYFRSDVPYSNSRGSLPDGIDVRGIGGYVIAPGATLPDGRSYRIVQGSLDTIPTLPAALAALLHPKADSPLPIPVQAPQNVTERDYRWGKGALNSAYEIIRAAKKGQRNQVCNDQLIGLFELVANGSISEDAVKQMTFHAMSENGYISDDGEEALWKTLESAKRKGIKNPRPLKSDPPNIDVSGLTPKSSTAQYQPIKRSITLVQCSTIQTKPVTWLWDGFIPQGKLTLLAGAGGTGKSTLAFNFAATVSNGGAWADGSRCIEPGNVLVFSSEDDPSDTITPRLMAVGADLSRCGIISGAIDEKGERCPFDAARDMDHLREAIQQIGGVSLLIIDPIVTAVSGDMHKANDVRRSLQSIVDFAAGTNCAVLGITHFAKDTVGKNSAERVIGSQAFAALARMVLVAAKEEESQRRVFTRAKSNNSVDTGGFEYFIEAIEIQTGMVATRVRWGEPLEGSSRSILAKVEGDGREDGEKMRAAKQFLLESLANGPGPSKEIAKYARDGYGISEDTLRRAYREIGVKPYRVGFGSNGTWMWALPIVMPSH